MKTNNVFSHIIVLLLCILVYTTYSYLYISDAYSRAESSHTQDAKVQLNIMLSNNTDINRLDKLIHTYCPRASLIEQIDNYALVELDAQCSTQDMIDALKRSPFVTVAEPNYSISPMQLSKDTYTSSQWALDNTGHYQSFANNNYKKKSSTKGVDLNVKPAWAVYNKNSGAKKEVIVAVIDTGVDITHEDLKKHIWTNHGEIPGDGIDNDDNGYIDDINGWDFYNNDNTVYSAQYDRSTNTYNSDPKDNDDHGTHVAGIIGAVANNHKGIAGAASNIDIKIMPLKIEGGKSGNGTVSSAVKAIKYAEKMGAKVCNISWGSTLNSAALAQAIKESSMLFVTAAGNTGTNNDKKPIYPASYNLDNIISVTFVNARGELSSLSNYGKKSVDIAAPGYDILSTMVGSCYGSMSGSSMAVPHVSSIAAMVYASADHLYASQVKGLILEHITTLSDLKGKLLHPGIPDAEKLVYNIHQLKPDSTAPTISCSTSYTQKGIQVKINAKDKGGSGIRVIKYLYGRQSLDDFEHGTIGTTITDSKITVQKSGIYTFYASDYAGNEQRKVYEVSDDRSAPIITSSVKRNSDNTTATITCSVRDSQSGVKEVKYLRGKKKVQNFTSSNTGKLLKQKNGVYSFKAAPSSTYTIYVVDYRGNKSIHVVHVD